MAFVIAYVPAVTLLGAWPGVVLGPLSVLPVALAAWAYGLWGGLLTAFALSPLHVYMAVFVRHEDALWVSLFVSAVNACVGAVFGALFDRLRRTHAQQRESEERYERAARGASDGLIEWDLRADTLYFSPRFAELLGRERTSRTGGVGDWFSLVHPDDEEELRRAIDQHRQGVTPRLEHDHRLRCADDSYLWVHVRGMITQHEGIERLTAWTTDVSARKQAEHELRFHAFRDSLTGLANRSLFMDRLSQALTRAREREGRVAVLLIDLDRFKRVNDGLGHAAGDGLLLAVSQRLRSCVSSADTVARLGGDEFALLLPEIGSEERVTDLAQRVRNTLLEPAIIKGRSVISGCSIGVVISDQHSDTASDLVRDADTALYRAKARGRGQWARFDSSMRERAVERLTLENELRNALNHGEIEVFYQPIVDATMNVRGIEALPRWKNPRLGLLMPGDFIALAEETGLIMELGDRVLSQACEMGRRVLEELGEHDFTVHVNFSPLQIRSPDLVSRVDTALRKTGLDPSRLCIEVTEDLVLEELPTGGALFEELRQRGIKLCMDDFGTGYSSLSYLHRFRVDFLKIETAFVHNAEAREGGAQIVRSLVNLAKNLGVTAIAEGVETQRQWDILRSLGCPRAQGFFIATPLSSPELLPWVKQQRSAA